MKVFIGSILILITSIGFCQSVDNLKNFKGSTENFIKLFSDAIETDYDAACPAVETINPQIILPALNSHFIIKMTCTANGKVVNASAKIKSISNFDLIEAKYIKITVNYK